MSNLIDFTSYPVRPLLSRLLRDKTTKKNIIFATDAYAAAGVEFTEKSEITAEKILFSDSVRIRPRVEKAMEEQASRTRKKAEVFTPSWVVNKMNNHCDEEWFGQAGVFNNENGTAWETNPKPVPFDTSNGWKKYVDSRRIEITCGEAPYIVSRYDAATGEIIPVNDRIGILDRKLRVVNENATDDDEWLKWSIRALQSSYGYEFQGDNLLIARINVLLTFLEHYNARLHTLPDKKLLFKIANIICWNFWQMDGLSGTIPFSIPMKDDTTQQISFVDFFDEVIPENEPDMTPICKIWDWRRDNAISYDTIRGGK